MKKSLLAVLLAVALVTPVFAGTSSDSKTESKFDIVGKLGMTIAPSFKSEMTVGPSYEGFEGNAKNNIMLTVEGFYKLDKKLSVGLGVNYMFDSELDPSYGWTQTAFSGFDNPNLGFVNIYASVKPQLTDTIYAIGQIGYGIPTNKELYSYDGGYPGNHVNLEGGIYFGIGAGVEYQSFVFEVLYTVNQGTLKEQYMMSDGQDSVFVMSRLAVNVGYKFAI